MNASRIRHGVVAAVAVALIAGAALSAGSAFAAKGGPSTGGHGGGKHGGSTPTPTSSATLSYAPNPVPVGSTFTISGKGFAPNSPVSLGFWGGITVYGTTTDASGSFSFAWPDAMKYCGSSLFDAIQNSTTVFIYIDSTGC